jgi:predicted benzoate:H+ symporter BenE
MMYLVLLWFLCWCLVRLLKTEPAITVVLIAGIVLGLLIAFGLPHIEHT